MSFGYPVMLELAGRRCVVIGAQAIREGKVEGLLAGGADDVLVVEPTLDDRFDGVAGVEVRRRAWRPADLDGAFLAVASSDDAAARAAIAREARARGVLVNVVDDIPHCDWAAPAVVRRGDLVLAIGTGGRLARGRAARPGAAPGRVRRRVGRGAACRRRGAAGDAPVAPRSRGARPAVAGGPRPRRGGRAGPGRTRRGAPRSCSASGCWTGWRPRDGTRRPRRRRSRRSRADHGARRPGARRGGRRRLRPARRACAARPGATRRRADLRRQGAGPRGRAAARDRAAAGRPRARRRDRRPPEGRRPVRLRARGRGGGGVRRRGDPVRGRAGRVGRGRGARRRPGSRSRTAAWPVPSRSSPARRRTTTRWISRRSRAPTRWSC